jgi:hypothetical protein
VGILANDKAVNLECVLYGIDVASDSRGCHNLSFLVKNLCQGAFPSLAYSEPYACQPFSNSCPKPT